MSHTTTIRRAASVVGATGLLALSMAGPASAGPDAGPGEIPRCSSDCYEGGVPAGTLPGIAVDTSGFEVLQLGAGILAGVALAGAGMAVASRRSHAHAAHPA
jgi:hypothetical protein